MISSPLFQIAGGAHWTPDGKRLLVIGGVGLPAMASQGFRGSAQPALRISLTRIDKTPDDRDINTEEQAMAALNEPAQGRGGRGAGGPGAVNVTIEWDGMDRRIRKLTSMPGSVGSVVPSPDSHTYAFLSGGGGGEEGAGGPGLYTIADDGTGMKRLNTTVQATGAGGRGGRGGGGGFGGFGGNEPQWSRDGRSIYMMLGGGVYAISVPAGGVTDTAASASAAAGAGRGGRGGRGGAGTTASGAAGETAGAAPRRINFTVRMKIDRAAERKQVFEEAWRTMKNRFYDAKMHGVNWAAAEDKYESLLEHVADTDELHNVIMEMIGELNASHTGISGGGSIAR